MQPGRTMFGFAHVAGADRDASVLQSYIRHTRRRDREVVLCGPIETSLIIQVQTLYDSLLYYISPGVIFFRNANGGSCIRCRTHDSTFFEVMFHKPKFLCNGTGKSSVWWYWYMHDVKLPPSSTYRRKKNNEYSATHANT